MKFIIGCLGLILMLCVFISSVSADVIGTKDAEIQAIAEPILDNILEGFKTDNYYKYSKDFDETLRENVPEEQFIKIDNQFEESIGDYQNKKYLGFFNKGKMTVILWKAGFDKSEDDILIKLVVSKRGSRYLVTGLWFQ